MLYGYIRVSTADEITYHQVKQLLDYGCYQVFQENTSREAADKVEFNKLHTLLVPGDIVVTTKIDRLACNTKGLLDFVEMVHGKECFLVVLDQGIDSRLYTGKIMLQMFAVFAEFEGNLQLEQQCIEINKIRKTSRFRGRPRALTNAQVSQLKALWNDRHNNKITREQLAAMFSISVQSVYNHVK